MGVKESLIRQFWPYKAWWCQISQKMNFGLLFQKWSLGTQESFCKVSDQLDTWLNNYGLISRHTSGINCVNNCTFIFTRHQPRLFLKALLVYICISICQYFISVLYQYVYFFIILYIEGKHLTTIGNNVLLNTNYSKNTYLFMKYFPELFHNKYKSDAYIRCIPAHTCT